MKILITGNSGFIGNHLTKYLADQGHSVTGCDLNTGDLKDTHYVSRVAPRPP